MGYTFKNKILLVQALTHPSYSSVTGVQNNPGNSAHRHLGDYQRLEFFGDALIDYIVIVKLFQENEDFTPEHITTRQHSWVSNDSFSTWGADVWELHKFMRIDSFDLMRTLEAFAMRDEESEDEKGEEDEEQKANKKKKKNMACPKALADVVESLAAAVFLDSEGDVSCLARVFMPRVLAGANCARVKVDRDSEEKKEESKPNEVMDTETIMTRLRSDFPGLGEMLDLIEHA